MNVQWSKNQHILKMRIVLIKVVLVRDSGLLKSLLDTIIHIEKDQFFSMVSA